MRLTRSFKLYASGKITCRSLFSYERWKLTIQVRFDKIPVHDLPKILQILRSFILIIQIVRMLPHVTSQKWNFTVDNGIAGIFQSPYHEVAMAISDQPNPSSAKKLGTRTIEFTLKFIHPAK